MENAWFYEKLFFEVVIVMVNNKIQLKRYNDTMFSPPLPPVSTYFSQNQSFADVLQNRCSKKLHNVHRKTPVLKYLFNKVTGLRQSASLLKRDFNTDALL